LQIRGANARETDAHADFLGLRNRRGEVVSQVDGLILAPKPEHEEIQEVYGKWSGPAAAN
jgi:hypothetical protein